MAHLLRGKQAGVQGDFSSALTPDSFSIDYIIRYGINSQISALAYDPVQSLLAIGTNSTKFGHGQIHIFGQKRVNAIFALPKESSVRTLAFCADKLVCLDLSNQLTIYGLEDRKVLSTNHILGQVTTICTDPSLDYVLLGLATGEIIAYDMDRGRLAPFRLPNFWREYDPRAKVAPVEALALHPRDVGSLLIGYAEGAAIYSFKQNKCLKFFRYEVPRGAPGGDGNMAVARRPRLVHAVWHPTGTFILTGHEDGSLVFWDAKDGRVVMARTLTETSVDKPSGRGALAQGEGEKEPLRNIVWCANQDPEDTMLLISGGTSRTAAPSTGLTVFELGRTPVYATSSWQILSQYFAAPKRQRMLPIPPNTNVITFCMIPRTNPYFAGAHDPVAILALLGSGELITMSFPSGYPISPTNMLHPSVSFVHPFITAMTLSPVERSKWLGTVEKREKGLSFLVGGAEARRPSKSYEHRNIVQTAHADGIIRLWDAGHGDDIENDTSMQVDLDRAASHPNGAEVSVMSLSGATGEFSVGTKAGEVIIFTYGRNKSAGREVPDKGLNTPGELQDIGYKADPKLHDGFIPTASIDMQSGSVTAIKNSDVGFIAAGFQNGTIIVIDMRGPAVIYKGNLKDYSQQQSKSFGRKTTVTAPQGDYATYLEFSVMTLEEESYSSILLHVGTSKGLVATLKVLPQQGGRYGVQFTGVSQLEDRIIRIVPLQAESGNPAYASQQAVGGLRQGTKTNGVLLAVSPTSCRIFRAPSAKGASKSWDGFLVQATGVTWPQGRGSALVTLSDDGVSRAFTLPGIKELSGARIGNYFDMTRLHQAIITGTGDIFGFKGPAEASLINVWGRGIDLTQSLDILYNPELTIPPRPTISNVEWLSGTQHVTPVDLDMLIGGPDRPPSKRMLDQMARDGAAMRPGSSTAGSRTAATRQAGQQETYWEYMQRQITERTEKLGSLEDGMGKLEETTGSWAESASKFVAKQKRNLVMGAVKGKMGL